MPRGPAKSPLDGMSRGEYTRYQDELARLLESDRKVRSDKGTKKPMKRFVRKEAPNGSSRGTTQVH